MALPDDSFGLLFPFGIDNGELDGLRANECFVLGFELGQIWEQAMRPDAFERLVHAENVDRIEKLLATYKRVYKLSWFSKDTSESWLNLGVEAMET